MSNARNTTGLTPWRSNYTEVLAPSPICVKLPVAIDAILREKENRSDWIRFVITLHLSLENSLEQKEFLNQLDERIIKRLLSETTLDEPMARDILQIFYDELYKVS